MSDLLPLLAPAYLLFGWLFLRAFVLATADLMLFDILIAMREDDIV